MRKQIRQVRRLAKKLKHIREDVCHMSVVRFVAETELSRSTVIDAENINANRDRSFELQEDYVQALRKLQVSEKEIAQVIRLFDAARRAVRARRQGHTGAAWLLRNVLQQVEQWVSTTAQATESGVRWIRGTPLRLASAAVIAVVLLAGLSFAVAHLPARTPAPARNATGPSVTPTAIGDWIVTTVPYGTDGGATAIAFENPRTGGYEEPLDPDAGNGYDSYGSPVLSPVVSQHTTTLAYAPHKIGGGYEIWIARVQDKGSNTPPAVDRMHHVLQNCDDRCSRLRWSADGTMILFEQPGGKTTALNPLTGRTHLLQSAQMQGS